VSTAALNSIPAGGWADSEDSPAPPILAGVAEPSVETSGAELRRRLDGLTVRDAARLGRRLKNLRGAKAEKLQQLADQIAFGRSTRCNTPEAHGQNELGTYVPENRCQFETDPLI
jgi:hypothetical protein